MPALMIPLINEVFHTDYPEDIAKAQLRNEHLEIQKKLITDSILKSPASQTIFCKAIDGPGKEWMIPWGGKILELYSEKILRRGKASSPSLLPPRSSVYQRMISRKWPCYKYSCEGPM